MIRSLTLLFVLLVAVTSGRPLVENLKLDHVRPSEVAERLDLLTGAALGVPSPQLRVIPDDATQTLRVEIPTEVGDRYDQQRIRLILHDYLEMVDQPSRPITVSLFAVRPGPLSEDDFLALDADLRRGPLDLPPGATAKGVVYWTRLDINDQVSAPLAEERAPMAGMSDIGELRVAGRLLPYYGENGRVALAAQVRLESSGAPIADGGQLVQLEGHTDQADQQPLVFAAGRQLPMESSGALRYELVVYLWAQPAEGDELASRRRRE